MPYILPELREYFEPHCPAAQVPGELNFQFTCLINKYIKEHGMCYQTVNDILGAFEGAKMEFYDRKARNYEDKKIEENGDVYEV